MPSGPVLLGYLSRLLLDHEVNSNTLFPALYILLPTFFKIILPLFYMRWHYSGYARALNNLAIPPTSIFPIFPIFPIPSTPPHNRWHGSCLKLNTNHSHSQSQN